MKAKRLPDDKGDGALDDKGDSSYYPSSFILHPSAFILHPSAFILAFGEVQEWLNWQHWKCCVRGTVPWVRIPPSPPVHCRLPIANCRLPIADCPLPIAHWYPGSRLVRSFNW